MVKMKLRSNNYTYYNKTQKKGIELQEYRICLPFSYIKELGWEKGDWLNVHLEGDKIWITSEREKN